MRTKTRLPGAVDGDHHVPLSVGLKLDPADRVQPSEGPRFRREEPVVASTDASAQNHDRRLIQVQGMPVRRWLATTPGLLRAASVLLIVGLLALGVVAFTSASARGDAARAVGSESAPKLLAAQNLYAALSDADATASTIFLTPGREKPALRQRYLDDLE